MWEPRGGRDWAQERGGVQTEGNGRLSFAYSGAEPYCYFDPGRAQYIEVDATVKDIIPFDGDLCYQRENLFSESDPFGGVRGPFTAQAGLTLDQIAAPTKHIVVPLAGAVTTMERAINSTGGTRRMYRLHSTSTDAAIFSLLVKRSDGGVVSSSIVELGFATNADPLGADVSISVEGTVYKKITDDGWYQVSNYLQGIGGAATHYFFADWKDGASCYYECPQNEIFSTRTKRPTARILNPVALDTNERENFIFNFMEGQFYKLPACGWIAAAFVPNHDTADANWTINGGTIVRWHATTGHGNDYHQIYASSSQQEYAYQAEENNVSQAYLQVPEAQGFQGVPIGMVATWGWRSGTPQFVMCDNGSFREIDISGSMPDSDTQGTRLGIARSPSGGSYPDFNIYRVACGNRMLDRQDCMLLSKWFETFAVQQNNLYQSGA